MITFNKEKYMKSYTDMIEDFIDNQEDWEVEEIEKWGIEKGKEIAFILKYFEGSEELKELHVYHTHRMFEVCKIETRMKLGKTFTYEDIKHTEKTGEIDCMTVGE